MGKVLNDGIERYGSPWLTPREAGLYAHCGEGLIREVIANGSLCAYSAPGSRDGSPRALVDRRDVDAWIRTRPVEPVHGAALLRG